jgi:hypothetical protein
MAEKLKQKDVEKWFEDRGSKLLSTYIDSKTRIFFLCSMCGKETSHAKFPRLRKDNPTCVCVQCHFDRMRLSMSEISEWFKSKGSEILNEITSVRQSVVFKCSLCGRTEKYCSLHSLKVVNPDCKCKECNGKTFNLDTLQKWFVDKGSKLFSTEYVNNVSPLQYSCSKCGSPEKKSFRHLQENYKNNPEKALWCKICVWKDLSKRFKYPKEKADIFFKSKGSELLEWNGYFKHVKFKCCNCGGIGTYANYSQIYKNRFMWCLSCWREYYTGESNPRYNHELSKKERILRRNLPGYLSWVKQIYRKFNYSCVITKKDNIKRTAHHLYNWRHFEDFRFSLWNGVLLSKKLHLAFHSQYGFGNNTFSQFKEFYLNLTGKTFYPVKNKKFVVDILNEKEGLKVADLKQLYHLKGINYLSLLEQELLQKPKIFDSFFAIKFQVSSVLTKKHARKLIVKELTSKEAKVFFTENHRQGHYPASVALGLFDPVTNELLSAMSFGQPRFAKDYQYELLRFCNKNYHLIPGAASKLFKSFLKNYNPLSIISYCDVRFSSLDPKQTVYSSLGFKHTHTSRPNYFYIKDGKMYSRIKFQKHKLREVLDTFDPKLSERENMLNNGYDIFKDCGNHVFVWNKISS